MPFSLPTTGADPKNVDETDFEEELNRAIGAAVDAAVGPINALVTSFNVAHYPSVNAAVVDSIAESRKVIRVDTDYATPQTVANRSKVVFIGNGSFAGTNSDTANYRRQVIPENSPSARGLPDDQIPLKLPSAGGSIVIVGDSLTTANANMLHAADGLSERLERKLRQDNPRFEFDFWQRGIGATRFDELNSVPSGVSATNYPWYTDPAREWLEYVEDLAPDIVFVSSGMNDRQNFDIADFKSVVAKLNAMPTSPQIVFITNMVPTLSPTSGDYGTYADQEGRDQVAGYIRSYANFHGYKCIDINRTFNMVRDGRDIRQTYLVPQPTVTFGTPSEFIATDAQRCRDYSAIVTLPAAAFTNATPIAIKTGSASSSTVFVADVGGKVELKYFGGGSSSLFKTTLTDIDTPAANSEWEFAVKDDVFTARLLAPSSNNAGNDPVTQKIIRLGGLFRPTIEYFSDGSNGPCLSVTLSIGVEKPFMPLATDDQLWGDDDGIDGNGINHLSSFGAEIVYGTHFAGNRYEMFDDSASSLEVPLLATVDGTVGVVHGEIVSGDRLKACNALGEPSIGAFPATTSWMCLGRAAGTTTAERATLWKRVG